ncbi:hypothetical protein C922_01994 [Plasmodium inui San Antonio 1]|uniref:OTU domain-containing protein n=1 Tax=Plasmodium inui San Antonio 1 TaxID=1237626 RepID=W7A803_9APIC|nr:hypothetical protein C922_01994 [Plasmodium inui San Antonio 1]EUD67805.1 hypothetical protein C922_01994 [Plasmodium inui San Antonio 1]
MARKRGGAPSWMRALLLATLLTIYLCNALVALTINKEDSFFGKRKNDDQVKISTVVFNLQDERMYLSEEYFENLMPLQNLLMLCFKSDEKSEILKEVGIDNVRTLFYENFKNEVYEKILLLFKFIKENFSDLTKRVKEEKEKNYLSEEDYLSDERLLHLLEDVITNEIEKNAFYFEKLIQFITLRKCITIHTSMNLEDTTNPIVLIMKVDPQKNQVHFKITNYLSEMEEQEIYETVINEGQEKEKVRLLKSILNPIKTNSLVMKMTKKKPLPVSHFRNLCTKHNFQVASENWVEYFYTHNETLCHVETCGSGDCLFLSLQYLLDKNGVRTSNVVPSVNVPESSFIPWYVRNVKQTGDPKFNVTDLRYLSTFYFIKFFPGYNEEDEIDEHFINGQFDLLINLEFTNYYLKKNYLYKVMQGNKSSEKKKSVMTLISNYMNKYLFSRGRPLLDGTQEDEDADCSSNTCKKGNTEGEEAGGTADGGSDGRSGNTDGSGNADGSGGGSAGGTGSGSRGRSGTGLSLDKRGGGPIRGREGDGGYDDGDGDVPGGNHNSDRSRRDVGQGRKSDHRPAVRRRGSTSSMTDSGNFRSSGGRSTFGLTGSSGNLASGNLASGNLSRGDVQEKSAPPLSPHASERSLNSIAHRWHESTNSRADAAGIGWSESANAMLGDEDKVVKLLKVEEGGEGKKFTKNTYRGVTYAAKDSPAKNTTVKHRTITLSFKRDNTSSGDSGRVKIPPGMRSPSLSHASRVTKTPLPIPVDASTHKYKDNRRNMEIPNTESAASMKDEYQRVVEPYPSDSENSEKRESIDIVKPKRHFSSQGILATTSESQPKRSVMRLTLIEKEKKNRFHDEAITESGESTNATEESQMGSQKDSEMDSQIDSQIDSQMDSQMGIQLGSQKDKDNDEQYGHNALSDPNANNEMTDYDDILEEVHQGGYRIYELIFFKLVSLSANKMTYDELKKVKRRNMHELIGANLKSKVIGSHVFMKQITQGTILPFFNYVNIKNKLNNVNRKENYANRDLYVIITDTTFNKKIKRPKDGLLTRSLLFKHNGDCISYWSIKNNHYHFTCDNKVIQTKTIEEKASAFFYERTRTGHIHWGDETDYEGFQKMFNIGLITFINNSTKFFFPKDIFTDYPVYFLIYFYSGIHFEPGIHFSVQNDREIWNSAYESTRIPPSFRQVDAQ